MCAVACRWVRLLTSVDRTIDNTVKHAPKMRLGLIHVVHARRRRRDRHRHRGGWARRRRRGSRGGGRRGPPCVHLGDLGLQLRKLLLELDFALQRLHLALERRESRLCGGRLGVLGSRCAARRSSVDGICNPITGGGNGDGGGRGGSRGRGSCRGGWRLSLAHAWLSRPAHLHALRRGPRARRRRRVHDLGLRCAAAACRARSGCPTRRRGRRLLLAVQQLHQIGV
mmetsp:Transcript_29135/g.88303  ORF Transcript_29135/g.88303 Transcript_29135/m.88303 type:complete len:226 (+) Transcript_29135:224-901(+)